MVQLAIWGPAFISLMIRYKQKKCCEIKKMIMEYGIYSVAITLIAQLLIDYGFRVSGVTQDALMSFSFFTKYVVLEVIIAFTLPFLQKLLEKYIQISVEVGVYDRAEESEKQKKENKDHK